jgi:hypothetical protein
MPSIGNGDPSIIARAGLLPLAFTVFGIITYGLLALVFVMIQEQIPGTKQTKGCLFGALFAVMWALYLLEPLPGNSGLSLFEFLAYPLADGVSLLFIGVLLGRFLASNTEKSNHTGIRSIIMALIVIVLTFLTARYLYYNVFHIYSFFAKKPLETMVWATSTGIWIGIMYLSLNPGMPVRQPILRGSYFGIIIFGIDLTLFNLFLPMVFEASVIEFLVRSAMDIIPVTIGVYIVEKVRCTKKV